jgi:hypothetical protein
MLADESADCAVLCLACIFGPWVCMVWRGRLKVKLLIMMLKIEFKKIEVAYRLIRNIKGYLTCVNLLIYPFNKNMTVI